MPKKKKKGGLGLLRRYANDPERMKAFDVALGNKPQPKKRNPASKPKKKIKKRKKRY